MTIIRQNRPGYFLIRGAAGSGKTTSALVRLRYLRGAWRARRTRLGITEPLNVLVLTFNRTLRGYIDELARESIDHDDESIITVSTFAKWSKRLTHTGKLLADGERLAKLSELGRRLELDEGFLRDEADYALGRFLPENLSDYLTVRRDGRGNTPRVNRKRIYEEVLLPYIAWKSEIALPDWNDMAVQVARRRLDRGYDIVVADEVQDFSANQIRAVVSQLAPDYSVTFVLDQAQQIYPRGFATWNEVGVIVAQSQMVRLQNNYRNTRQIARFAAPLLQGLAVSDDGTLPNFDSCITDGPMPKIIIGDFSKQASYAIRYIQNEVDSTNESVAFLHPTGWFKYLMGRLSAENLRFAEITRQSEWPQGDEFIALSTLHSAKGLEFDHVILLGINAEVLHHGSEEGDTQLETLRKLLAMAFGRAKRNVIVGHKAENAPAILSYLNPDTYEEVIL